MRSLYAVSIFTFRVRSRFDIFLVDVREAVAADHGQRDISDRAEGIPVGAVHFARARAAMEKAVAIGGGAEHGDLHLGDLPIGRGSAPHG